MTQDFHRGRVCEILIRGVKEDMPRPGIIIVSGTANRAHANV